MGNVAKINLEVRSCAECPFMRMLGSNAYCTRDTETRELKKRQEVPGFCPFVLERLDKLIEHIESSKATVIPKKYLVEVEKKQKENDPNQKFTADHGFNHAERVYRYGAKFLKDCVGCGYTTADMVYREERLLKIAAMLHDVGLADSPRNHAIHSAEIVKKYLAKMDINDDDADMIVHAIYNHSKGRETNTILDAALLLGDKLDVTRERFVRVNDPVTFELSKLKAVRFDIVSRSYLKSRVDLHYYTYGGEDIFDVSKLMNWKKCITIPKMIAEEWLEISDFRFFVNDVKTDISVLC